MGKTVLFRKPINDETITSLLEEIKDEKEVELLLDSGGGDLTSAISFHSFIKTKGIDLTVNVLSRCESAAVILLCAGKKRIASKNARFLLHPYRRGWKEGIIFTTEELEAEVKDMERLTAIKIKIAVETIGQKKAKLEKLYQKETVLTAHQSHELGFLTEEPY